MNDFFFKHVQPFFNLATKLVIKFFNRTELFWYWKRRLFCQAETIGSEELLIKTICFLLIKMIRNSNRSDRTQKNVQVVQISGVSHYFWSCLSPLCIAASMATAPRNTVGCRIIGTFEKIGKKKKILQMFEVI